MAKKYVHNFAKYMTIYELMDEIYPLLTTSKTKEEILDYLNVSNDLDECEVDIKITNYRRNIELGLKMFDFSSASLFESDKRKKLIEDLSRYGIYETNVDIKELGELIEIVLKNKNLIETLNNLVDFSDQNVRSTLYDFNVISSDNVLLTFADLVRSTSNDINVYQPIFRNKYYDEFNHLICKVEMDEDKKINGSNLQEFKGIIYENLNFKNKEEAIKFMTDNCTSDDIDEDTITFMEFVGEENNNNWPCHLTIVKEKKGCIFINYGEHLFINNIENNVPITEREIKAIIEKLKHDTPQNEFFKHVKRELDNIRKMLKERDRINEIEKEYDNLSDIDKSNLLLKKTISFRNKCLDTISFALNTKKEELQVLYQNRELLENKNKTILVKVKITSSDPILCKERGKVLKKY